ncbi:MAG: 4-hydroxyphenylpyruvate dioxygenase, partial [uncultured Solirubrobacteraceae bacterium]
DRTRRLARQRAHGLRRHAAARHRPRRALRRQRRTGGRLLSPGARLQRGRLRGARDGEPRSRLARAATGRRPPGADRRPHGRPSRRAPRRRPRRRREGRRAVGSRCAGGVPPGGAARRRCGLLPGPDLRWRWRGGAGERPGLRPGRAHLRATGRLRRGLPAGLRGPLRERRRGRPARLRSHRRQRGARRHGPLGRLLRARLRHGGAQPLHRRGDLDRVLGADVEGGQRRVRADQVPHQRAGGGATPLADRRVPRLPRRSGRPAPGADHRGHRLDGLPARRARDRVPAHARLLLRGAARARRRARRADRRAAPARHPRRPRRGGLPAAGLLAPARRPADALSRGDRAPRGDRLRTRQLQGAVRGHRARAGAARQPL